MKIVLKSFIALISLLTLLGIIMVLSASGYSSLKIDDFYFLFNSHIWKVVIAFIALVIFSTIPYEHYKKISKYLLLFAVILLIFTLISAVKVKGAARWLDLGLIRFQPSEMAKVILLIHLAYLIERRGEYLADFKKGFIYPLIWIFAISTLVLLQPNVSTSIIIIFISFALLFVGGARIRHLITVSFMGILFSGTFMMLFSHSRARILSFWDSINSGGDINSHVYQSKIALGSGGFLGVGLGLNRQSDGFVFEPYGDFIFSILGEELGFIGGMSVLFGFLLLFTLGLIIAKKAPDKFGQLLAFGLIFNITISAFIHAAVVMGILPTTGITLPFISYGGTSIISYAISAGIIINIALQTYKKRELRLTEIERTN